MATNMMDELQERVKELEGHDVQAFALVAVTIDANGARKCVTSHANTGPLVALLGGLAHTSHVVNAQLLVQQP